MRPSASLSPSKLGHLSDAATVGVYREIRTVIFLQLVGQLDRALVELVDAVSSLATTSANPASQFGFARR